MTTEEMILKDESAENRACDKIDLECGKTICIHQKTPEQIFRLGFKMGREYVRRECSS